MDIEVSLKIRSAIKAKLVELGCHVDEELPDYIMVLIANRRTRAHMEEDLQLFLGDNTSAFTAWLHHVLKKLEEITTSTPGKSGIFSSATSSSSIPTPDSSENVPSSSQMQDSDEVQVSQASPEKPKNSSNEEKGQVDSTRKKVVIDMKKGRRELTRNKIKINKNNFDADSDESPARAPIKKLNSPKAEKKTGDVRRSKRTLAEAEKPTSEVEKCSKEPYDTNSQVTQSSDKQAQFRIPVAPAKKSRKLARNNDEDLEDCLNLKAEADDLFLDPGAQAKPKSNKTSSSNADVDVKELEVLRENVLASRRKRPLETLNRPSQLMTDDEPPNSVKVGRDVGPQSSDKSDRKKISPKNMEILSRLIKSNSDVRTVRREPRRSISPKRKEQDNAYRPRPRRPSSERDNDDRNNHLARKRRPEREPESQKIKQLKSSIGSVITRVTRVPRNMPDEEYDPSCPEVNNKSNKVQSVIKVPEVVRRRKLSPDTQTNKKLLFLAMADAEKSLLQTRQVKSRYEEKETAMESQNRNTMASRVEKPRKSVHERLGYMSKSKQIANNQDKLLEKWVYSVDAHDDDELETSKYNRFEGDETIIINVPNESTVGRNVTVESKDSIEKLVQRHKSGGDGYSSSGQLAQPKRISIQVHSDSSSDDEENNNQISTTTIDYSYKSDGSPSSDRPDEADADVSNDYDILINEANVTLPSPDAEDQNEQEVQENSRDEFEKDGFDMAMSTKKASTTNSHAPRIQITVNNTPPLSPAPTLVTPSTTKAVYSTFSVPQSLQPQQVSQGKQLCKFWPNCTFSDKCIYTHPTCKFNNSCTKSNCPYKHTSYFKNPTHQLHKKPSRILAVQGNPGSSASVGGASKICKFFPKCHTLSCTFYHPTPCRFGTGCTDVKCSNYHPGGSVAGKKFLSKNKTALFKWKAPSTTSTAIPVVPEFKHDTINSV